MINQLLKVLICNSNGLVTIVLLITLLSSSLLASNKKERVRASAVISIINISPEAARRRAFRQAESSALESVVRELSSVSILSTTEDDSSFSDLYRQNISSRTSGVIVSVDTLVNTIINLECHVEIEATIIIEEKSGASPYDIKIKLEPREIFEAGDEAYLKIDVLKDSYLHIFNITADNRVLILYPLTENDIEPISGGTTFVYPNNGSKMRLFPIPSHDVDQEEFRVVATKEPMRFFASDLFTISGSNQFIDLQATDIIILETGIIEIPYDERGQARVMYEVRKK